MRNSPEQLLLSYLQKIGGDQPWIEPHPRTTSKLPLFLRQRYNIFRADLFGRKCLLALEKPQSAGRTPTEYGDDARLLRKQLSEEVILVLSDIPAYVRNRLVHQGIPFIVPNAQMFLPMLMIDLREHFSSHRIRPPDRLTSISQVLILYQILRGSLEEIPLGQIASKLGYSAMAISKAQDELQKTQLCDAVRSGRTVSLHFTFKGKHLWQKAEPLLSTPIKRTKWIRWGKARARAAIAGLSALSRHSMLADDSLPTYAMRDLDLMNALENSRMFVCAGREDAEARMESWKYDPWLLTDNEVVDPASLYLSLRQYADERIQRERENLLNFLHD